MTYAHELFLNRDELIIEDQMDRLDKVMHEYLILQKNFSYGRDLTLDQRDSYIETIRNMQHMIDHLWAEVLMAADTQIARQIRQVDKTTK